MHAGSVAMHSSRVSSYCGPVGGTSGIRTLRKVFSSKALHFFGSRLQTIFLLLKVIFVDSFDVYKGLLFSFISLECSAEPK